MLLNVAYALIYDEVLAERRTKEAQGKVFEKDWPEQVEDLDIQLGMRFDSVAHALAQHRAFMEAQGKEWDDTPVERDWREEDREIPGNYMGNPNDPARKGK